MLQVLAMMRDSGVCTHKYQSHEIDALLTDATNKDCVQLYMVLYCVMERMM